VKEQHHQATRHAFAGEDWSIRLTCHGCAHLLLLEEEQQEQATQGDHEKDSNSLFSKQPWFYVRAYGPAVLTGIVEPIALSSTATTDDFRVTFHFPIAGQYWTEVVITYSHPFEPNKFPLSDDHLPPPFYEGYVLPGFPLPVTVVPPTTSKNRQQSSSQQERNEFCRVDQLTVDEGNSDDLWKQAAWRVTKTNRQTPYSASAKARNVTLRGYQWGNNSLGFQAAYEHRDCRLHEHLTDALACTSSEGSFAADKKIHIIMIGDSVMRLQRDYLKRHLDGDAFDITFMEIFGGALRCARSSGPYVTDLTSNEGRQVDPRRTITIFNTGMHDIHRLCGHSFKDDRSTYLTARELQSSCVDVYRRALQGLVETVQHIPAAVRIFQTTTAAWPKYGNYGIAWDPRHAQELPLDAAFAERFNRVAVNQIGKMNEASLRDKKIFIVDAYWMTLSRPDNRETNKEADIGKKLSHPGYEVTDYMVRVWWQVAMQLLCMSP